MPLLLRCLLLCCLLALAGCPKSASKGTALDETQYAYSAAIRWGDFEGAWNMLDPELRERKPMTALEFERYKQVKVSRYEVLGSQGSVEDQQARQEVQIDVINEHTQIQRSIRYTEQWRYDPVAKAWWVTSGMPDFWAGM
jgi:hypothetical protein